MPANENVIVAVNNDDNEAWFHLPAEGVSEYLCVLSGDKIKADNGMINICIKANYGDILLPLNSETKEYVPVKYEEVEYVAPVIVPELTYTLVYERNEKLKVGDEVYFYLQDDQGRRLNDYSKFDFYTLLVSADGNQIFQNHGERPHFTYTKEMGANVSTYTILYDSTPSLNRSIALFTDSLISLCSSFPVILYTLPSP